jgi:hypothetical protein
VHLADLRDDDEALSRHLQQMRLLHVAGENEDQHVAGSQPVVLIHRAGRRRLELGGETAEGLESEDLEPAWLDRGQRIGQRVRAQGVEVKEAERIEELAHRVGHGEERVLQLQ